MKSRSFKGSLWLLVAFTCSTLLFAFIQSRWSPPSLMGIAESFFLDNPFILWVNLALTLFALAFGLGQFYLHRRSKRILEREMRERTQTIEAQARKLQELNASQSDMFADIVHEIRTPLSLIMQLNESIMIERYGTANGNIKGASRIALRNGKRLINLVEEILELSKLDMIKVQLQEKPVHFHAYVQGLYAMLRGKAASKHIQMSLDYQLCEALWLSLDQEKFEKIFNNLVGNALKFTPVNGRVKVRLEEAAGGENIHLVVADTGPGISEEDLQHIFDRYYQSKSPQLAPKEHGVGIGLALVKNYADLFEGELSVDSHLGQGTTFVFSFPPKKLNPEKSDLVIQALEMSRPPMAEAHTDDELATEPIPKNTPGKLPHVLVVEDNEDMLQFLKELLEREYHVSVAGDGQEALEVLVQSEEPIDFVLSDMVMPNMDGFGLLKAIRGDDDWRDLPFLMLTAESRASQRIDAFTFGVDDYLLKPFSAEELLVRIKSLLKNSQQRIKWQQKDADAPEIVEMAAKEPRMTAADLDWLKKLETVVQGEVGNRQFNVLELASTMAVSERQLFRMIKRLTGMTPNKYLRDLKLYKAKELLENYTYGTISEVSYAVGFEDPHYFSKIYASQFGKKPSDYLAKYASA